MAEELTQEQLLLLDNLMFTCFTQYDEAGNVTGHVVAFRGTGGIYDA